MVIATATETRWRKKDPTSVTKGIMSLGIVAKTGGNPTKSCSLDTTLVKGLLRSLTAPNTILNTQRFRLTGIGPTVHPNLQLTKHC